MNFHSSWVVKTTPTTTTTIRMQIMSFVCCELRRKNEINQPKNHCRQLTHRPSPHHGNISLFRRHLLSTQQHPEISQHKNGAQTKPAAAGEKCKETHANRKKGAFVECCEIVSEAGRLGVHFTQVLSLTQRRRF